MPTSVRDAAPGRTGHGRPSSSRSILPHHPGGAVRVSHAGPAAGLAAQVLLLAVLAGTVGLGAAGWFVGVASAVIIAVALARALARGPDGLGPASWVTLVRATLAVGLAALTADSFTGDTP